MVKSVILNSSNYITNSGNIFRLNFNTQLNAPEEFDAVAIQNLSVYNSTNNITSNYGNNTITLIFLGTSYTFTFPDGYYSASDMNAFLQSQMVANGLYVIDSSSNYGYFVEIVVNSVRYAISLNLYPIPTSATASSLGYSQPSSATWSFPSSTQTPQVTINSAFGSLIGQYAGTYPSTVSSSTVNYVSVITPIISPVNSYILTCNLVDNKLNNPNNLFFSVPISVGFGELIINTPPQLIWNDIRQGKYDYLEIRLYDQLLNILNIQDYELTILLALRTPQDKLNFASTK